MCFFKTECKNLGEIKRFFWGLSYTFKKAPNKWNDPTAVKCQVELDIDLHHNKPCR